MIPELLGEFCPASAMAIFRYVVSRYTTAWAESSEWNSVLDTSPGQSSVLPAEIPTGYNTNEELKRRLQLGKQERCTNSLEEFSGNSAQGSKLPQREKQRTKLKSSEESAPVLAEGSISKAMKGLVGGAAAGTAEQRKHCTAALSQRSLGRGTHPTGSGRAQAARAAWTGGRYKEPRRTMREQGRGKTGLASLPHVTLAPISAIGPTGEEPGAFGCGSRFPPCHTEEANVQSFRFPRSGVATDDLSEECRFPLGTQPMFLKTGKSLATKMFDGR